MNHLIAMAPSTGPFHHINLAVELSGHMKLLLKNIRNMIMLIMVQTKVFTRRSGQEFGVVFRCTISSGIVQYLGSIRGVGTRTSDVQATSMRIHSGIHLPLFSSWVDNHPVYAYPGYRWDDLKRKKNNYFITSGDGRSKRTRKQDKTMESATSQPAFPYVKRIVTVILPRDQMCMHG